METQEHSEDTGTFTGDRGTVGTQEHSEDTGDAVRTQGHCEYTGKL